MKLVVFSHKPCWVSLNSPSNYATDGGFPYQMKAISELFELTTIIVPIYKNANHAGEIPLEGYNLIVSPVTGPIKTGLHRKIEMFFWIFRNSKNLISEFRKADAVHVPIPGDIGTIGMLMAFVFKKPLFVRYCGNWNNNKTLTKKFLRWFIERFAGGIKVMMATGGDIKPPSRKNPEVGWIFATSLTQNEIIKAKKIRELKNDGARLIIVGRQEIGKGTDLLIESLPAIEKEIKNVYIDVVGDGSALNYFREKTKLLNLENKITFHGKVNKKKVMELLNNADLFCFPTETEGFPKAVLEALASGLPVITTRVSVLPTLLNNGCGILLDKNEPEKISEAVIIALSDNQKYRMMSKKALETASRYSLEKWRDAIGKKLHDAWGILK